METESAEGRLNLTHTLENNLTLACKIKHLYILWPSNSELKVGFRGTLTHVRYENCIGNINNSIVHNIARRMDK